MRWLLLIALMVLASCTKLPECNAPFILADERCCLDKDGNAICDDTEIPPEPEAEPEPEPCVPDWECSTWGECVDDLEERLCRDNSNCGVDDSRPSESRDCDSPCVPDWDCSSWTDCSDDGKQSRDCDDDNDCGVDDDKPEEARDCTPQIDEPDEMDFYGSDILNTRTFMLEEGVSVFSFTHDGTEHFSMSLVTEAGGFIALLSNTVGEADGAKAMLMKNSGLYYVEVDADGHWELNIKQPRPTKASSETDFEGTAQQVTEFVYLEKGTQDFDISHEGTKGFIVTLIGRGRDVELVDTSGDYSDTIEASIIESGLYIFDVEADGDWMISIV